MTTPRSDDFDLDYWENHGVVDSMDVHERGFNPHHQGFIGFIEPKGDGKGSMREITKTARRIAVDLVLMPVESRGSAEYPEDYLKQLSGCRTWPRLRCAYCDCHKGEGER